MARGRLLVLCALQALVGPVIACGAADVPAGPRTPAPHRTQRARAEARASSCIGAEAVTAVSHCPEHLRGKGRGRPASAQGPRGPGAVGPTSPFDGADCSAAARIEGPSPSLWQQGDDACAARALTLHCRLGSREPDRGLEDLQDGLAGMDRFVADVHPARVERECRRQMAVVALEAASRWHRMLLSMDDDDPALAPYLAAARGAYEAMLSRFPDLDSLEVGLGDEAATRHTLQHLLAEVLWTTRDWAECGPAFDRVVDSDPAGDHSVEAAYAAVLCRMRLYEDRGVRRPEDLEESGDGSWSPRAEKLSQEERDARELERLRPRALTESEKGMLHAFDRYVCLVPASDELVAVKYRRARIHYVANHWEEAAVLFREIAYEHSDDDLARYGANLYLDCLNQISRLDRARTATCRDEMAGAVEDFLGNRGLMRDAELAEQLAELRRELARRRAEAMP